MDKNKEKNNSDTTKASYMDQLFWKMAFLSDGIANCINCCYNFDSHKFATELNNIYRDLSDDEIRTISERKILPVFSETSITNIPSSNLSYYNKTCLLMGLQVNYSCSYLGEPLKMILAHTNRILSLENIPLDIYVEWQAPTG